MAASIGILAASIHRRALVVIAAAALLGAAGAGLAFALAPGAGPAVTGPRFVGPAPVGERIQFTLVLRLPGAPQANEAIGAIENPSSALFRHFLSPRAFGARFGISTARLSALERTLKSWHLRVIHSFPQRTELVVAGTVGTVYRLLHVRVGTYADGSGRRFHAPLGRPALHAELKDVVAVAGLDTRPHWRPHDVPVGGLTPATAGDAYDVAPLRRAGFDGHGLTIAVISFSAFEPSDQATWMQHYGVKGPAPRIVAVDGGTTDTSGADETNLDIEVIRDVAPAAQIVVYEAPQSDSAYGDLVSRIVADHQADVVASSWGACELTIHSGEFSGDRRALSAAVASGVTVFAASGDSGAYDCQRVDLSYHGLSVDWPAASSNVVAVGGTRLDVGSDGRYRGETAWEDQLTAAGGGGGVTTGDARPSWQAGPGVIGGVSNGHRQLPDVSADADPGTPWAIYSQGQPRQAGGTSAAAPFWAASMLLIDQYAVTQGVRRPGFVDPLLYVLASSRQRFAPFHDVTVGSNRYYQAGVGWDAATGLGSPDVFNVARDLVAYLRAHPAR